MHSNLTLKIRFISIFALLLLFSSPLWAQRTGDHIVPAIETVCDGDPFSFGLCNAYCEALDCDSETPLGTPKACANKLKNYVKKSGGALPPCEASCPCEFDVESDFVTLVEFGDEEFAPPPIDVAGTYDEFCDNWGPNGENSFIATALQFIPTNSDDPQGVALAYWVEDETENNPASCTELGGGFDGLRDLGPDFSYGPWIERKTALKGGEKVICRSKLLELCAATE